MKKAHSFYVWKLHSLHCSDFKRKGIWKLSFDNTPPILCYLAVQTDSEKQCFHDCKPLKVGIKLIGVCLLRGLWWEWRLRRTLCSGLFLHIHLSISFFILPPFLWITICSHSNRGEREFNYIILTMAMGLRSNPH